MELHAVIQRDLRHQQHRIGIIRVHMKNRRVDHLRHVTAPGAGAHVAHIGCGETDLVVDDDMHRAAGMIAARLRHAQHFHHHALAGKRRIAVQQNRYDFRAVEVLAAMLARAHRAFHHRIDDFQMRRIECQRDMQFAARRGNIGRKTLMVFHVAGSQVFGVDAFEFGEQHLR